MSTAAKSPSQCLGSSIGPITGPAYLETAVALAVTVSFFLFCLSHPAQTNSFAHICTFKPNIVDLSLPARFYEARYWISSGATQCATRPQYKICCPPVDGCLPR